MDKNFKEFIKPGLKIFLEVKSGLFRGCFVCKILKVTENEFIIPYIFNDNLKYESIIKYLKFFCNFYIDNSLNGIYEFESNVVRIDKGGSYGLVLRIPEFVGKVQRRKYYRVDVNSSIGIDFSLIHELSNKQGQILDISAGGLLFRTSELLHINQEVDTRFKLGGNIVKAKSRIARLGQPQKLLNIYGIEFKDIDSYSKKYLLDFVGEINRVKLR